MRFSDHAARKKLSKKEKSLIDKPWIDFYLRHLMRVRDTSFKKYCRAEKSNIHAEYKVLRNEVKLETKQAKKIITRIYSKNLKPKPRSIKDLGSHSLYCQCGKKKLTYSMLLKT